MMHLTRGACRSLRLLFRPAAQSAPGGAGRPKRYAVSAPQLRALAADHLGHIHTMHKILLPFTIVFLVSCNQNDRQKDVPRSKVDVAAHQLIDAREQNRLIELPDSVKPKTIADGYKIQDRIIQTIGIKRVGWKLAITSEELMQKLGINEPVSGPLFEKWVYTGPHTVSEGLPTLYGFEFEFAFKLATDLPPREQAYSRGEVQAAVASMHLAIESVGSRYTLGPVKSGVAQLSADHGGNFGLVYGPAIPDWQGVDLAQVVVTGYFDGQEIGQELGANVMGNPIDSLTWLANHLPKRGYSLKAGEWVTTGAVVGPIPAKPPVKVRGVFGDLGSVTVSFER